jgi:tetratricopeptide (TPR) repeat protein
MTIVAFGGLGGVGKTSLALTWAHRNLFRFPDGQLHVNLRGFDPSGNPVPPVAAVRGFLDALGVTPAAIPADEDAQVALYRSLVAGKRLLVVLDNVRDTAQVEPLLPGSETCTVLVTSRNRLSGLGVRGALLLDLDVFDEADALKLLKHHLGARRIVGEAGAVTDVLRRCAGLPLAISILASRAAARPGFGLDVLAKELGDASARLDALEAGDLNANLRAVFSWSYQALDPDAARVLRLLGVAPGPDISMPAAAALTEFDASRVRRLLRVLVTANLLQEYLPGRYRMHDLLRLYATELACDHARQAALRRLTDFYLHTAYSAARLLRPERPSIDLSPPVTGCTPLLLADRAAATEWFSAEHACLLATLYAAVERGSHASVWKLAWTLSAFHVLRGHLRDDLAAWRAGVAAARQLNEPVTHAVAAMYLGTACARAGYHAEAIDHLRRALALAERADAVSVLADVHRALGWAWEERGDDERALIHAGQALRLYQATGNAMREADALNSVGWLHARLGRHHRAIAYCERALGLSREHGHRRAEAVTLDSLGYIAQQLGQHARALDLYREALTLARDTDDAYDQAGILANLGEVQHRLGHHSDARGAWRQALDLYSAQHRTHDAEDIQRKLDGLLLTR